MSRHDSRIEDDQWGGREMDHLDMCNDQWRGREMGHLDMCNDASAKIRILECQLSSGTDELADLRCDNVKLTKRLQEAETENTDREEREFCISLRMSECVQLVEEVMLDRDKVVQNYKQSQAENQSLRDIIEGLIEDAAVRTKQEADRPAGRVQGKLGQRVSTDVTSARRSEAALQFGSTPSAGSARPSPLNAALLEVPWEVDHRPRHLARRTAARGRRVAATVPRSTIQDPPVRSRSRSPRGDITLRDSKECAIFGPSRNCTFRDIIFNR